jgi:Caspase domain
VFKRRSFLQALIAFCAGVSTRGWGQARLRDPSRIALLIGNNAYRKAALANAANDAKAMQTVLSDAGFVIDTRIDAGADAMAKAVREFGAAIARPEVKLAIFYYAGHGVQVEWRNYLLPVDSNVTNRADLRKQTFDLGVLLDVLPKSPDKTFVVILDACRDNPFGDTFLTERKGLSQFDAPLSTLIAFSTSPGSVASDGTGGNGLYTENLARELRVGGLRIEDVFKRVRANVSVASRGLQIPWESTSLVSDVYVFPPPAPLTEEELERQFEEEVTQWNRVKGSKNPADWAALLRAFPSGKLSEIAQARLNLLLADAGPGTARGLERHRGIVLGPGLPVPDFLGRPENPYSAGTYALDRRFSVGDEATYVGFEEGSDGNRRFTRRVTKVDVEADRVELNRGRFATDLLGNPVKRDRVEYAVPVQIVPAQLQVGKRWTARFAALRRHGEFDEDMSAQIVARETVKVPAGTFDAFRIEARIYGVQTGGRRGRHSAFANRQDIVTWEVPGLNFAIKEHRTLWRRSGIEEERSFELESLRQKE